MMYARVIFAVFAILWVQSVCAGTDPIVVDRTEHPYVVGLRMNNGQNASGVVIAPHILLTVAHELFDVDGNKLSLAAIRVRNGSDRTYLPNVARIKIHARMETRLREGRRQKKIERDYAQLDVAVIVLNDTIDVPYPKTVFDYTDLQSIASSVDPNAEYLFPDKSGAARFTDDVWRGLWNSVQEPLSHRNNAKTVGFGITCLEEVSACRDGQRHVRVATLLPWEQCRMTGGFLYAWCYDGLDAYGDSGGALIAYVGGVPVVVGLVAMGDRPLEGEHLAVSLYSAAYFIQYAYDRSTSLGDSHAELLSEGPYTWGGVYQAMWRDAQGRERILVNVIGTSYSQSGAARELESLCWIAGGGRNCKIVETFSGKGNCRYVTTGLNKQKTSVHWGSGETEDEALARCADGGYSCRQPMSACNME